jgi:hypothetical protein
VSLSVVALYHESAGLTQVPFSCASGAVVAATMGEVRKSVGTFMFFEQTYQAEVRILIFFASSLPTVSMPVAATL